MRAALLAAIFIFQSVDSYAKCISIPEDRDVELDVLEAWYAQCECVDTSTGNLRGSLTKRSDQCVIRTQAENWLFRPLHLVDKGWDFHKVKLEPGVLCETLAGKRIIFRAKYFCKDTAYHPPACEWAPNQNVKGLDPEKTLNCIPHPSDKFGNYYLNLRGIP